MNGRLILTAAEMRAAEERAIAEGTPVEELMNRAGTAAAEAIWRYAGPLPALILCGPGNNGGDGYVVAQRLKERGVEVRVAALADPVTPAARAARDAWDGPVGSLDEAAPAVLLVDALFGTGLKRPLGAEQAWLARLAGAAKVRVAIDLPSGIATDDGRILSPVPDYDLTITFQTLKPAHRLQPAARHMGRIVVADIGIHATGRLRELGLPALSGPGPDDHKYIRGFLLVVGGAMPGAAALAAGAAARSGAGYVALAGEAGTTPQAVVRHSLAGLEALLADKRVSGVLIGPGLGRGPEARDMLDRVMAAPKAIVLDGDALTLVAETGGAARLRKLSVPPILTPHAGEFARLFGETEGDSSKVERTRAAAERSGAIVVFKGADTVIATPDGYAAIAPPASPWLASAGTGDVLAGIVAGMLASGIEQFSAACAGVALHGRAAELAGPALTADDLLDHLPAAVAEAL